jgi:hypothetical protein
MTTQRTILNFNALKYKNNFKKTCRNYQILLAFKTNLQAKKASPFYYHKYRCTTTAKTTILSSTSPNTPK